MSYFTTHETFFVIPLSQCDEEMQKIDHFLILLEKSGVGDVIKNTKYRSSPKGRKSYNPYNLFASILFLYSKRITSVRDMAEAFMCDLRLIYIMQQECPSYKTINDFIKNVITPFLFVKSLKNDEEKLKIKSDNILSKDKKVIICLERLEKRKMK